MNQDLGLNVILKRDASKVLKASWMIVLLASICGLGFYVKINYVKLSVDPVVLVKARYVNSRTIPFPAVTICPPNTVAIKFLNLTNFNQDPNLNDRKILTAVSHVCSNFYNMLAPVESKMYFDDNIVEILSKVVPKINEMFEHCAPGMTIDCSNIFIKSVTYRGICFSFNMLGYHSLFNPNISADFDSYKRKIITKSWDKGTKLSFHDDDSKDIEPSNWTIHDGYSSEDDWVQPMRASGLNYLAVTTKIYKTEISNFCEAYYNSYRVNLHFPDEIPTFSTDYTQISLNRQKYIRISASINKIDENLRKFPPDYRKCYTKDEKKLRFFKSYTKLNCEHECMSNFTYKWCGCASFSMLRTDDMKVCGYEQVKCAKQIFKNWSKSFYEKDENKNYFPDFPCNCFPTCTRIDYSIMTQYSMSLNQVSTSSIKSGIHIVFGTSQILETTNYVSYSVQNFVSDIGGLVGLFLGISLLSLFELTIKAFGLLRFGVKGMSENLKHRKTRKRKKKCNQYKSQRMDSFMPDLIPIDQLFGEKIEQSTRFDVDIFQK